MKREDFVKLLKNPSRHLITPTANGSVLRIDNETLSDCHIFEKIEVDFGIIFQRVKFSNFSMTNLISKGFVRFENCETLSDTYNNFGIQAFGIFFKKNDFDGEIQFKECKTEAFSFLGGEFKKSVKFFNNKVNHFEIGEKAHFQKPVYFFYNNIKNFDFKGGLIDKLIISSGTTDELSISDSVVLDELTITGGQIKKVLFDALGIGKIEIKNNDENKKIDEIYIQEIIFQRVGKSLFILNEILIDRIFFKNSFSSKESIFNFYILDINDLLFADYVNYGQINLISINIKKILYFTSSDVGKLSFINCYLDSTEIFIRSSKIIDSSIIGGSFPVKFVDTHIKNQLEALSQIKKIYENRGSQKDALEFYSREMNALNESLNWKDNFWEKITLWFNKYSTNHGVDWKQGLKSTFYVSAGFFLLYIVSLWSYTPNLIKWDYWCEFFNVLSQYFDFINPAHKTDIVAEKLSVEPNPVSRTIEGLSRIFIAYFIYQLIQAFRKHGKK
jgi:hypothetical protein